MKFYENIKWKKIDTIISAIAASVVAVICAIVAIFKKGKKK